MKRFKEAEQICAAFSNFLLLNGYRSSACVWTCVRPLQLQHSENGDRIDCFAKLLRRVALYVEIRQTDKGRKKLRSLCTSRQLSSISVKT